jgi:uncharacterized protein
MVPKSEDYSTGWVETTEQMLKQKFQINEGSHDWFHIDRVRRLALLLAEKEGGDHFIIEMAALLHDLDDWKLKGGNKDSSVAEWLDFLGLDLKSREHISLIIEEVSFKGAGVSTPCSSVESRIVQDADRLDALGAIGISRAFAYGGSKGHPLHRPGIGPHYHDTFHGYQMHKGSTINHFYEKLLLLKERLNTPEAIRIAEGRHRFMLEFLEHFFREWEQEI